MSWRYPRFSAPSDRDYDAPDMTEPFEVAVTCIQCGRSFYVRADERPPYRCHHCTHNNAEREQQRLDQDIA